MSMERVIAYVDGNELHSALHLQGWQRFAWLDIPELASKFLQAGQELVTTRYFVSLIDGPEAERRQQAVYLEALQSLPGLRAHCSPQPAETSSIRRYGREEALEVNRTPAVEIAVELLLDAALDRMDAVLLCSTDGSLAAVLATVRRLERYRPITVVFPPGQRSPALEQAAASVLHIGHPDLSKSQLPDRIVKGKGMVLKRPEAWR